MHLTCLQEAQAFARTLDEKNQELKVLDIGSQDINGSLRETFNVWKYWGVDVAPGKNVDQVLKTPYAWAVEVGLESWDVIVTANCIEHVPMPWRWISQLFLALRPGGVLWISAPNRQDYHAYPVDCWRPWPDGMKALLEDAGFTVQLCYDNGRDTIGIARKLGAQIA